VSPGLHLARAELDDFTEFMEPDEELLEAAAGGDVRKVRRLLELGIFIDTRDEYDERTPLHLSAYYGRVSVVRLLLEYGADVEATDSDGCTPLHLAAFKGHLSVVKLLLEYGADVDAIDNDGGTPLHLAAANGHKDIVELLLERGADVNAKDNEGRTPLDVAREEGHVEVARVIEEYGRGGPGAKEVSERAWSCWCFKYSQCELLQPLCW